MYEDFLEATRKALGELPPDHYLHNLIVATVPMMYRKPRQRYGGWIAAGDLLWEIVLLETQHKPLQVADDEWPELTLVHHLTAQELEKARKILAEHELVEIQRLADGRFQYRVCGERFMQGFLRRQDEWMQNYDEYAEANRIPS
jgi:hypothetical protein